VDIGKGIQRSFELFTKNAGLLIPAGIVVILISIFTFGILGGIMMGGFLMLCLKVMRGEKGEFNEIFTHFDKFVPTFLLTIMVYIPFTIIIISLIPLLGGLFAFVAGPLVNIAYAFALILIIEKNLAPVDAFKEAFTTITAKNPVMTWVYVFVCGILSFVGSIACFVGVLATLPFAQIAMAVAYNELYNNTPVTPSPSMEA